jgi:hypothetical protein
MTALIPTRFDNGQYAPKAWQPIESSNLNAGAYVPATGRLYVEFADGSIYRYTGVPEDMLDMIASADSPGSEFHQSVVRGDYPFEKVA